MRWFDLCVITQFVGRLNRNHIAVARAALEGGAPAVQLRDKEMTTAELVRVAAKMRRLTSEHRAAFIVNDRVDVALAVGADGVHLGPDDMPVETARRLMGPGAVIGASVASVEEARAAEVAGASYVSAGAIYATPSKADAGAPIGVGPIAEIKAAVSLPVLAIGGITCENVGEVVRAGADGVAVISAVSEAGDMVQATRALLARIRQAQAQRRG
jgi:thiamine-phosphate diphosphorylase